MGGKKKRAVFGVPWPGVRERDTSCNRAKL